MKKRILIISSDPADAATAEPVLTGAGYDVDFVSSGWLALESLSESPSALLLIEIALPVMGGVELTRRLRALPSCRKCSIVLAGALAASDAGAWDAVLAKPLDETQLLATVSSLL